MLQRGNENTLLRHSSESGNPDAEGVMLHLVAASTKTWTRTTSRRMTTIFEFCNNLLRGNTYLFDSNLRISLHLHNRGVGMRIASSKRYEQNSNKTLATMKRLIFLCFLSLYNLFWLFFSYPVIILFFWQKYRKDSNYLKNFSHRLGLAKLPKLRDKTAIWMHAASLGEVKATTGLVQKLLAEQQAVHIFLTTATPTGFAAIPKHPGLTPLLAPLDHPLFLGLFLLKARPKLVFILERELWPNMLFMSKILGSKLFLLNARLSQASFSKLQKLSALASSLFCLFTAILAQSRLDERQLGYYSSTNLHFAGNLKIDRLKHTTKKTTSQKPAYSIWAALSIRDEEYKIVVEAFRQVCQNQENSLILMPRHLENNHKILSYAQQQAIPLKVLRCLDKTQAFSPNTIYLLKAYGLVQETMSLVDACFVGGSLVAKGGQSMLEPISCSVPILMGNSYYNFEAMVEELQDKQGILMVKDAEALAAGLQEVFANREKATQLADNASIWLLQQPDALELHYRFLMPYLLENSNKKKISG